MVNKISLLIDLFQEIALWISVPFMIIFYKNENLEYRPIHGQKDVIIVERWLYKNLLRKKRLEYLRERGINVYGFFDYLQDGTFDESAVRLHEFIIKNKFKNLTLIGISGGGITCLAYLEKYDWLNVDKFISIGTPYYGTPLMFPLVFIRSARKLLPNSNYLKKLREQVNNTNRIYCFKALFDILVPSSSAVLEGSTEIKIHVIGHNNMYILNEQTYDKIEEIVKE